MSRFRFTEFRALIPAATAAAALLLGTATAARAEYVQPHIAHAPFGHVRLVVPVTSADPEVWSFKLRNLLNAEQAVAQSHGSLEARVVLYGAGVKLLHQPSDDKLKTAIDQLRAAGVHFEVCNNTLKGMQLDWHELYGVKESDIVPSGFLEVGWLANQGWAIDPMN